MGVQLRKCCGKDKKIHDELIFTSRLALSITKREFQLSPSGKGVFGLVKVGGLPKCINNNDPFFKSAIGTIDFTVGPITGKYNVENQKGGIGWTPSVGASLNFQLVKGEYEIMRSGPIGDCCGGQMGTRSADR